MSKSTFSYLLKNVPAAASVSAERTSSAEFTTFIDTGSYTLNAALSGSLFGGMASNKVLALAGESSVGKSFFALSIAAYWQQANPEGVIVYFDTESAVTDQMMVDRGIDTTRVVKVEPETLEEFRQSALQILDNYNDAKPHDRPPMFMILDSLGNLSSAKEMQDTRDQKDTRDMTKAGLVRGIFRVLRLRLAKLNVAMVVTNHTYTVTGAYVPTQAMSGGGGLKYASDCIVFLSKKKDRDKDKQVVGNIVRCRMEKSRLSKENSEVNTRISYRAGLDRYAGLLDMAVASGLVKKNTGGRYQFPGHDRAVYESEINKSPDAYFTETFLRALDEQWVQPTFSYGADTTADDLTDLDSTDD